MVDINKLPKYLRKDIENVEKYDWNNLSKNRE